MARRKVAKVKRFPAQVSHLQKQSARSPSAGHPLLKLQRSIGNQAVQRLIRSRYIQARLSVSSPGDQFEQEADRVADNMMRMPDSQAHQGATVSNRAQISRLNRKCMECEKEQDQFPQEKPTEEKKPLREQPKKGDEDVLQRRAVDGSKAQVSDGVHSQIDSSRGRGQPLPETARAFFEPRFGVDFGQVRVHTGAMAEETAESVNARAFTVGQEITFGAAQFAPESHEGRRLMAHELTHVVQQSGVDVVRAGGSGGNRGSSRLLAGPARTDASSIERSTMAIQRAVGDGHDLSSPRFRGDATLEACFDNEARLGVGDRGPAVFKVQQALIDLGFDLGPKGADGVFGPLSADAVKRFKARERLGFETIGDVGPGTMRRLDELFPREVFEVPIGAADEEGSVSCPTDEEIVTAGQTQGAVSDKLRITAEGEPGRGAVAAPVTIAEAVRRFKQKVNVTNAPPEQNLTQFGQFFWGKQVSNEISAELTSIAFEPGGRDFFNKGRALTLKVATSPNDPAIGPALAELDSLAAAAPTAVKPRMQALLKGTPLAAGTILQGLWAALEGRPDDTIPNLQNLTSIRVFLKMRRFEMSDCFNHAERVARRLLRKGGISPVSPNAPQVNEVIGTHNFVSDFRPILFPVSLDNAAIEQAIDRSGTSQFMMGQVMKQTNVASAVARMKQALDGGRLIHARVVSGVGFGGSLGSVQPGGKRQQLRLPDKFPLGSPKPITAFEEHSLLIIGRNNDLFVFSDPDASVSNSPEAGFGLMFFDNIEDRLGTGFGASGMPVNENGKTRRGQKRYQVISLHTI